MQLGKARTKAVRSKWDELYGVAESQAGHFTLSQAEDCGYSSQHLQKHLAAGRAGRIHRGIYRLVHFPYSENEELVVFWLWSDKAGVFSHETSLLLHGLTDALPAQVHMSLPLDRAPTSVLGITGSEDNVKGARVSHNKSATEWYAQLHNNPWPGPSGSNYTNGSVALGGFAQSRIDLVAAHYGSGVNGCPDFMRNLNCDFIPHLFARPPSGIAPIWDYYKHPSGRLVGDPVFMSFFAGSPFWGRVGGLSAAPWMNDNHDWFVANPWFSATYSHAVPEGWTNLLLRYSSTSVTDGGQIQIGLVTPPLTCPAKTFQDGPSLPGLTWHTTRLYNFWDTPLNPAAEWSKWTWQFNTGTNGLYAVGPSGIGDVFGIDLVPRIPVNELHGVRFNLEPTWPGHTSWKTSLGNPTDNIQTILVIQDGNGSPDFDPTGQSTSQLTQQQSSRASSAPVSRSAQLLSEFEEFARKAKR